MCALLLRFDVLCRCEHIRRCDLCARSLYERLPARRTLGVRGLEHLMVAPEADLVVARTWLEGQVGEVQLLHAERTLLDLVGRILRLLLLLVRLAAL